MELSDVLVGVIERRRDTSLPDMPVVLVQGPPRSGKTTLLDAVATRWERTAPLARLSLRGVPDWVRAHTVALGIADYLARRQQLPGRCFPRMRLASAAIEPPLPSDPQDASRDMRRRLRTGNRMQNASNAVVAKVQPLLPPLSGDAGGAAVGVGLAVLPPMAWWMTMWQAPYRWFGEDVGSGIEGLVQLNRWYTAGQLDAVDRAVVGAFLADLRDVYRTWRTIDRFTHRPVLLLDDAEAPGDERDGGARLRFLDVLLDIRNRYLEDQGEGDPLVLVATTGTRVTPGVAGYPFGRDDVLGELGDDLAPTRAGLAPIHRLDIAHGVTPLVQDHGPGRVCRRLAYGHPWALNRLGQAVTGLAEDNVDVENALTPDVVVESMEVITGNWTRAVVDGLVTRSAVDEQDESAHRVLEDMFTTSGLEPREAWELRRRLDTLVALRLWAAPGSRAMHPFFRTVLLSTLSQREGESPVCWDRVFGRLAEHHRERGGWHAHYELARSGDVAPAAYYLVGVLRRPGAARDWLDELDRITRAPRQRDHEPDQHYQQRRDALLAGLPDDSAEELTLVARVVTALWLGINHLGTADRRELVGAAGALGHLAERLDDGDLRDALFMRAAQYSGDHG